MEYRLPTLQDKEVLQDYVEEHYQMADGHISASFGLAKQDYEAWLDQTLQTAREGNPEFGKALLYLCFVQGKLIGLLSIRYDMPEAAREKYGDIGYGVRPTERRKGYATEMLRYAIQVCREKGMERITIGCLKENIASVGVVKKCGGILFAENENYKAGECCQYYYFE